MYFSVCFIFLLCSLFFVLLLSAVPSPLFYVLYAMCLKLVPYAMCLILVHGAMLLCSWYSIPVGMCYLHVTCVMRFLYVSIYHRSDKLKVACFAMQSLLKECRMQK